MNLGLERRVVYVTGGSSGIGKAIVTNLIKEGAYVGTCARKLDGLNKLKESLTESERSRLNAQECDVLDSEALCKSVSSTIEKFGSLDGIVANAGSGISGRILDTPAKDWISQYEMKLLSVLNLVQAAVPALRESNAGRVVIMNGVTANIPDGGMAAVSASRAAVKQYASMLAMELAKDDICVNVINIGAIETNRQIERYKRAESSLPYEEWAKREAQRRGILLKRFGNVDEVTPMVMLLLSPLSSYITATSIDIAGGLNARL